jgi:hypothetical protein
MDNFTIKEIEILLVSVKGQSALLKTRNNSPCEKLLLNNYDNIITKLTNYKGNSILDFWRVANNDT